MKQRIAILLLLGSLITASSRSLQNPASTEPAGSGARYIQIAAQIPNASAVELVRPAYPPGVHLGGNVVVSVTIDAAGKVVSARGRSGHPLLRPPALEAARKSRFKRDPAQGRKPVAGTISYTFRAADISYNELPSLVGKPVTLRGRFSQYGKLGPLVLVNDKVVYLHSKISFEWGHRYELMQDKVVSVTGTLRFYKAPPQPDFVRRVAVAKIPDHFYFQAESSSIELDQQ